jgi:hypothetical protein
MADDIWLPQGDGSYRKVAGELPSAVRNALTLGITKGAKDDSDEVRTSRNTRSKIYRQAANVGGDIDLATNRPRDPMFYWRQNNLPFEVDKPDELMKLREICRLFYLTNPVIASAIDIFSKYPLVGAEFVCKDSAITEFHTELFFNQLDCEEFWVDVLREYWMVGEAWPFGSWNELLGVWDDDELLNPNDIHVIRTPFSREPRFEMRLPETLRLIIANRDPKWEYERLMASYPELKNFMGQNDRMPVSNILLRQLKFKADTFNPRGIPILMRAIRYIIQEEMLNAAQESVASRLYMPLILAKLGASASDLGTETPWIPTPGDLDDFEGRLDAAFAADFRLLVHHFAIDMESVFGREVMPRLNEDFDRLTEKQLQVFGMSKTLLSGAEGGQTYAADALNRDVVSQLLVQAQKRIKRLYRDRALVVAEAQQHYDFEVRGGKRYPIMEERLEVDPDGKQRIVQVPKLLVPDLQLKTMNLHSEADERQFIEALRESGIPISEKTRMVNVPIDLDDEREKVEEEQIEEAVAAIRVQKGTYEKLRAEGLPIPEDLRDMFEPQALPNDNATPSTVTTSTDEIIQPPLPNIGIDQPVDTAPLVPANDAGEAAAEEADGAAMANVIPLPRNKQAPPESFEYAQQAATASVRDLGHSQNGTESYLPDSKAVVATAVVGYDDNGDPIVDTVIDARAGALQFGPRVVGIRRYAGIVGDVPLDEQLPEAVSPG